jgi:hypothetical protein
VEYQPASNHGEIVPGSTQQVAGTDNSQTSAEETRPGPSPSMVPEQPEEAQDEDEATAEAGTLDISSILGAPTVTVVRSTL